MGPGLIPAPMFFLQEQCPTYHIVGDTVKFLELYKNKPFFLYYSFPDVHFPQVMPEIYYSVCNPQDVIVEARDIDFQGILSGVLLNLRSMAGRV